jgi:hypothetical protein
MSEPDAAEQKRREFVDVVLGNQTRAWQRGKGVPVEVWCNTIPDLRTDPDAVLELIGNEVALREDRGEKPTLDEYLTRFPHLADALRKMFRANRLVGDILGDLKDGGGRP